MSSKIGESSGLTGEGTLYPAKHLKEKLEEYMARFSKVRIVRTKKREGLIRTRLLGASMARGEVLTFLDSHCEVNVNWLPPLLNQIALNHKTIVCPMIDVIDHNHFGYEAQAGDAMRGAFDWEMYYKRIPIPPELQRADPSDPFDGDKKEPGLDLPWSPGSQSREQELLQGQGPGVPATVDGEKKASRAWYPKGESERRAMHQKHKRKRRQHSKPEDGKPV
ncbi:polypeptide N-acetylgalactosaminyltransferase-like 6 [Ovis aries]|uniref:polypeptide N-acetylgalactosaminyltransferase-like 6 n=1 Tax=Ovis aries TaxID=9940 RepID=UPI00295283EC|nr:polypeptide N-acetylgalactosaminyltransferase-like 6 [Ovis aries]